MMMLIPLKMLIVLVVLNTWGIRGWWWTPFNASTRSTRATIQPGSLHPTRSSISLCPAERGSRRLSAPPPRVPCRRCMDHTTPSTAIEPDARFCAEPRRRDVDDSDDSKTDPPPRSQRRLFRDLVGRAPPPGVIEVTDVSRSALGGRQLSRKPGIPFLDFHAIEIVTLVRLEDLKVGIWEIGKAGRRWVTRR